MSSDPRPAVFLDRDGTLVHSRHYPSLPEHLVLYEDIAPPLRRLRQAGFLLIMVTNQAGISRGIFTVSDLHHMHEYLTRELAALDVYLDGIYYCPHHPEGSVPELAIRCDCRKPAPGMVLQAARERKIDLAASWFIGDILDDMEAGKRAGCRTVLVDLGTESEPEDGPRRPDYIARSTAQALDIVLGLTGNTGRETTSDLDYQPPGWTGRESNGVPAPR